MRGSRPRRAQGRWALAAVCLVWVSACGGQETAPTAASATETLALRLQTAHFLLHGDVSDAVLRDVAEALEADFQRILTDLETGSVRPITVRVWQDPAGWSAEVQRYFGRSIDTTGYVTGPDEIRVLAVAEVTRNAVHELCHVVSLHVNPRFANNPRWLWETVALYENREWVNPRSLAYLVNGTPPTLAELDADVASSRRVYEVGALIGEFVVARSGQAALVDLIRTNGDTSAVLGLSPPQFLEAWYAFVRQRYLD